MDSGKSKAAIEFLHFLADISDPVSGSITCIKLAAWLGLTAQQLQDRWKRRGANIPWQTFADELLAVLDAAQAQGHGLQQTIDWYLNTPLGQAGRRTADQLVIAGEARWLTRQLNTFAICTSMPRKISERRSHW